MCTAAPIKLIAVFAVLISLTACSSLRHRGDDVHDPAGREPEAVLIVYHVKPGAVTELERLIQQAWKMYQKEHMVVKHPRICVRIKESGDNIGVVEVFKWVSHFATEHSPASVEEIWNEMRSLCEERQGNLAMEVHTAEMLIP